MMDLRTDSTLLRECKDSLTARPNHLLLPLKALERRLAIISAQSTPSIYFFE
jgi:hypothetical protein